MSSEVHDETGQTDDDHRTPHEVLNPFVARADAFSSTYDRVKVALLTVSVLPLRVAGVCLCLLLGWLLACIGLCSLTEEEKRQPLHGWRDGMRGLQALNARAAYYISGWVVRTRGRLSRDAPLLVAAPHSSFADGIVLFCSGLPSIVCRSEARDIPLLGRLIDFTKPVYVSRDDPDSRRNTLREVQRRVRSSGAWPQLLLFPEGTCTNRTCLIQFKPGAFCPGAPVQPVVLRYPNRRDTVTWTWQGPGAWHVLWLTLTQFVSFCEIEYLPVYEPSEAEKQSPRLFADNVRAVMAAALGLPVTDYTYDDCRLMSRACAKNLPRETGLIEVTKLMRQLDVGMAVVEAELDRFADIARTTDGLIRLTELAAYLGLPPSAPGLAELFSLYDADRDGVVGFREFLTGVCLVSRPCNTEETIALAFRLLDAGDEGRVTELDVTRSLAHALGMTEQESARLFHQVETENTGYITLEEFRAHSRKRPEYAQIFTAWHGRMAQEQNDVAVTRDV